MIRAKNGSQGSWADVCYYVKIWPKLANPLQKRRFPINILS